MLLESAVAAAEPTRPLRVVTFNLLHGGASSGLRGDGQRLDLRLEMVVHELRALDPDVVALQEASTGRGRGNVAERLARQLGLQYVHAPATSRVFPLRFLGSAVAWLLNFNEGPAILSRFPIAAWEAWDLPRCQRYFDPRVLLRAELGTPWGPLQAFSTHTSRDPCQHRRIAELVAARRGTLPSIVMGDFNATDGSPAIAALANGTGLVDAFRAANPAASGLTVWQRVEAPQPTVFRRVDFVFVLPGREAEGRVRSSRVVLDTPRRLPDGTTLWPSDHYGVLAEVEVGARRW
jgi:endonuclease/exonuclease/phosphatase family metal-dependent hydrolase